jgi:peptidoglycan/LPS O-acetylase OafA/YrhL
LRLEIFVFVCIILVFLSYLVYYYVENKPNQIDRNFEVPNFKPREPETYETAVPTYNRKKQALAKIFGF